MNGLQRTLLAVVLLTGATAAEAQGPYTWIIQGTVTNCYPGQTVDLATIPGTTPMYTLTLPVDSNTCSFSASLNILSGGAAATFSTSCMGTIVTVSDSVFFG